jgi:hypothetical protein
MLSQANPAFMYILVKVVCVYSSIEKPLSSISFRRASALVTTSGYRARPCLCSITSNGLFKDCCYLGLKSIYKDANDLANKSLGRKKTMHAHSWITKLELIITVWHKLWKKWIFFNYHVCILKWKLTENLCYIYICEYILDDNCIGWEF